jgi:hypothetical protein
MIGSTTKVIVQRQYAVRCNVPNAGGTKIKFIACSLMQCRTAGTLKRYAWGNQRRLTVGGLAHLKAVKLLPSAPCSLERTVSALARIKPTQPLRICRYMPSISMDYFIARSTSH